MEDCRELCANLPVSSAPAAENLRLMPASLNRGLSLSRRCPEDRSRLAHGQTSQLVRPVALA